MSKCTKEEILIALNAYRVHISAINRRAFEILIPKIEAADLEDPDMWETPEEEEEVRLDYVYRILGGDSDPSIELPSDLLKNWDVVAPQLALDGARVDIDLERRATKRKNYQDGIFQGPQRYECPTGEWTLPADFEVLMGEIDSLECTDSSSGKVGERSTLVVIPLKGSRNWWYHRRRSYHGGCRSMKSLEGGNWELD